MSIKLDPERKVWVLNKNAVVIKDNPKFKTLRAKLLEVGGEEVVLLPEPSLDDIIAHGQVFGPTYKTVKGEQSQCHENVMVQFTKHPKKYIIATGYALSDDGLWQSHSWLLEKKGRTIETTVPRMLYFGVLATDNNLDAFRGWSLERASI